MIEPNKSNDKIKYRHIKILILPLIVILIIIFKKKKFKERMKKFQSIQLVKLKIQDYCYNENSPR